MIHQLVYVSKALTGPRTHVEIDDILEKSRGRNENRGVSGALFFRGGTFLQILEGPEEAVRETFASIARDPRHTNVTKLVDETFSERLFSDWSMRYRELDDTDAHLVNDILGWSNLILQPRGLDRAQVRALLERLR